MKRRAFSGPPGRARSGPPPRPRRLDNEPCHWPDELDEAIRWATEEARQRGADYLTPRRLAGLLGLRGEDAIQLYEQLADHSALPAPGPYG
jgi:hypothetical protein